MFNHSPFRLDKSFDIHIDMVTFIKSLDEALLVSTLSAISPACEKTLHKMDAIRSEHCANCQFRLSPIIMHNLHTQRDFIYKTNIRSSFSSFAVEIVCKVAEWSCSQMQSDNWVLVGKNNKCIHLKVGRIVQKRMMKGCKFLLSRVSSISICLLSPLSVATQH